MNHNHTIPGRRCWLLTLLLYICNCIKVTIPVVNHSVAPDSHRCPVPLCSNWMKIPSWCKAFKSSVYSWQKNELKNKQMNIIISIKNASFFHRLEGIIEHVGHSTENISPEPFNTLILCWSSSNVDSSIGSSDVFHQGPHKHIFTTIISADSWWSLVILCRW